MDASGVATDVDLFLPTRVVRVTMDGAVLQPIAPSARQYDLGSLLPDTEYAFELMLRGSDPSGVEQREVERTETLRFRTGSGASALGAMEAPAIEGHREAPTSDATADCRLLTERCSDTGQDTYLSFEVAAATSPLLWVLEWTSPGREPSLTPVGAMFPGSCRRPWLHLHADNRPCVRVYAIQADGTSTHSDTYCTGGSHGDAGSPSVAPVASESPDASPTPGESPQPTSDVDAAAPAGASGCSASSAGGGPSAGLALALTALLMVARRRTRRGRSRRPTR